MPKFCSCFKGNNDDGKKHKMIKGDNNDKQNTAYSFFLTGDDEAGRTKIIKELVGSHDPFTREEKILKIEEIERYIRDSLTDILQAFNQNDQAFQLKYAENRRRMTYILTTANASNFEYPIEFFEYVAILWADPGLQEFLAKSNTYRFPDSAKYFLNRVNQIRDPEYVPTAEDMIYSRLFSSPVFERSFDLKKEKAHWNVLEMDLLDEEQEESMQSFCNQSDAIIFITDCSRFDVLTGEKESQTQLHQSIDLYTRIRNNNLLETIPVILLLYKQDLLAKKIHNGVRLEDYFPDFADYVPPGVDARKKNQVSPNEDAEVTRAKYFIADQFLTILTTALITTYVTQRMCPFDIRRLPGHQSVNGLNDLISELISIVLR